MSLHNLSNIIGQINLANQHKKEILIVNNSLNNNLFFKLLLKENLIKNYLITEKDLIVFLKYTRENTPLIKEIKMISKPGKKSLLFKI
jgi:ribosomal protein S8